MNEAITKALFMLYVADQKRSAGYYTAVLGASPVLDVPGMTEFALPGGAILGLMPEAGIKRLLGKSLPDPSTANGVPRAELYLIVDCPEDAMKRAIEAGGQLLSPVKPRDWGDRAGYCLDPDGHVLAFARTMQCE